jgi:hypothetical protein
MLTSQVLNEDTQYFLKELFLKCSLRKFFEYALPIYNLLKHPLIHLFLFRIICSFKF